MSTLLNFSASHVLSKIKLEAIKDLTPFRLDSQKLMLLEAQKEYKKVLHMKHAELFDYICSQRDPIRLRALLRAKDNDLSSVCVYEYFQLKETIFWKTIT